MICKFVILAALVAVAQSGAVAPVAAPVVAARVLETEFDPAPQYTYAYDVQDSLTGDSKNQFETRNGDIVQGRYSLIEADGTRRVVDYTADPINGFNAVVQREPVVVKAAVVAPAVAKVAPVVAAPAKVIAPAPVVSAAPFTAPLAASVAKFAPFAPYVAAPAVAGVTAPLLASARLAAPLAYTAPVAPIANVATAPLVAAPPFARLTAPLTYPASLAYSAPLTSPLVKAVNPLSYAAAYTTVL